MIMKKEVVWAIKDKIADLEKEIELEGKEIEIRGNIYREIFPIKTIDFMMRGVDEEVIKEVWSNFDPWIAKARTEYIIEKNSEKIEEVVSHLMADPNTRRAFIRSPDWFWPGHPECVVAVQWIIRDRALHCFVFLRSSELRQALPYDIYTYVQMSKMILRKLWQKGFPQNLRLGFLRLFISNLHVLIEERSSL